MIDEADLEAAVAAGLIPDETRLKLVSRHRDCDGLAYRRMGSASGGIRS